MLATAIGHPAMELINATPHHIGCAVNRIEDCCATFAGVLGFRRRTRVFDIPSQQVSVCFVELRESFYIEFVVAHENNKKLERFLGSGFYHLCFLVDDLKAAEEHLRTQRFYSLPAFESEAFAGHSCQFFRSPQMQLIELAEMSTKDFRDFFDANLEIDT